MRLFISYSRKNFREITELAEILRLGGYEPWFDYSLIVGRDWQQQLIEEIERCDAFLYALTQASIESEWCRWEFGQAVDMGKPIIPVLMEKRLNLPEFIDHRQAADFTDGATGEAVARLMNGINTVARRYPKRAAQALPEHPKGVPAAFNKDVDELLPEAIRLAGQHGGLSLGMMQRELKIGYARAKRIADILEAQGIIGPYPGGSKLRPLLYSPLDDSAP